MTTFTLNEEKLAAMLDAMAASEGEAVDLGMWSGEEASTQLASILSDAQDVEGPIARPTIGGVPIELQMYAEDEEGGFILTVRPTRGVDWVPYNVQIASFWTETDDYLGRGENGFVATDGRAIREALAQLVVDGNALLSTLARLAPSESDDDDDLCDLCGSVLVNDGGSFDGACSDPECENGQ